jgi:DNA-binding transcriptional LysR family regulator
MPSADHLLNGLQAFVQAAETRSFVAAGQRLGLSASAIGKSVAKLEEKLGVRLMQRSTRRIHLTPEGELFLARSQRILADLNDAREELAHHMDTPRGRLRVSLPAVGYRLLLPVLPEFTARYPDIALDLDFSDRMVDVIDEGFDAVVRSGPLRDSRLQARTLGSFRWAIVGTPDYLAQRGTPQRPRDLLQHACLQYRFVTTGKLEEWRLQADPGDPEGPLPPLPVVLTSSNLEGLIHAALRGLGLAFLPDFAVREALAASTLQAVLADYTQDSGHFSVLWPAHRQLSPRLRVWLDFLCARLFPAST